MRSSNLDPRPMVTSTGVRYEIWQRPGVVTEFKPRHGYSQNREDYA